MREEQDALQEWVGKEVAKKCPNGHYYVMRRNRHTGEYFLGCSHYPNCEETTEVPLALTLRARGARELPGMETM
jgi:ssDNA-binding Zn-finger/Zn-ribbon topoisomerase 1